MELTCQYGRHGYRGSRRCCVRPGWTVNKKRVERIWRCEGPKVPAKKPKRGRLWLDDGSCVRLRPECPSHVWPPIKRPAALLHFDCKSYVTMPARDQTNMHTCLPLTAMYCLGALIGAIVPAIAGNNVDQRIRVDIGVYPMVIGRQDLQQHGRRLHGKPYCAE